MKRARMIYADSEKNADILYASKFLAPDAFVFLEVGGRKVLLLSDLEIDRGRREAEVDEVASYSELERAVRGKRKRAVTSGEVIARFLAMREVEEVEVPWDFPLGLAAELRECGVGIIGRKGAFWPEREIKREDEVKKIERACRIAEIGMGRGMEVLKAAKVRRDGVLVWGSGVLTAERLRGEMEVALVRAGGEADGNTIVACGEQACDPHERGRGELRAGELLILDIFPRDVGTKYFGDLTRTVVKGRASEEARRLWEICLRGQEMALSGVRVGVEGSKLQRGVQDFFAREGYPKEIYGGRWRGFFHGLGHGLGLEVHEAPRVAGTKFREGHVVTIEPGIYWPGTGGVRHEDVVWVQADGNCLLTKFPKVLEV